MGDSGLIREGCCLQALKKLSVTSGMPVISPGPNPKSMGRETLAPFFTALILVLLSVRIKLGPRRPT